MLESILYIEEDETARPLYEDYFKQKAKKVLTATNGTEGLRICLKEAPQVIITDLKMKDMNGIELIKIVRESDHRTPIIVFTPYAGERFLMIELDGLINYVVDKPTEFDIFDKIFDEIESEDMFDHAEELANNKPVIAPNQPQDATLTIVGIGASAGGLEALTALIKGLPLHGHMAYLIAQHLSPNHRTMLVELLSRETELTVKDAVDKEKILPNTIYITPPNKNIEVNQDSKIVLSAPEKFSFLPKPSVNQLFISLAQHMKDRAIGIILSGTGTDGSQGMRAINAEGGLTIVQDPQTAKYDGMPNASIESGSIDIVIEPSSIGEELVALANFPRNQVLKKHQLTQTSDDMSAIFNMLYQYRKVDFSVYKKSTIGRRIERRMVATKVTSLKEYIRLLQKDQKEVISLFQDILIGITSFFRDPSAFESLRIYINDYLDRSPDIEEFRVWLPGTSTGEEAYSILITLLEVLAERKQSLNIRIFATDIDEDALKVARYGVYSEASLSDVDEDIVKKYFVINETSFSIKKRLRESIVFSYHNILADPPFKDLDLIVCRNLMIYLNMEAQKYILPTFHYALKNNGLLFLGKSENASNFEHIFAPIDKINKIFKQIPSSQRVFTVSSLRTPSYASNRKPSQVVVEQRPSLQDIATEEASKLLLPNLVLTNEQQEVLFKKGKLEYIKLPEGYVSYNIFKMIDQKLVIDLRKLINDVGKSRKPASTPLIPFESQEGCLKYIKMHCVPVFESRSNLFVLYFQEISQEDFPQFLNPSNGEQVEGNKLLELELHRAKEHMQTLVEELETTNEELQSTNEELQSSNEELQSTNEELETSNEELQSTNEELQTAYSELKELYNNNNRIKDDYKELSGKYEQLLDNINQGVVVCTMGNIFVRTNQAMQQLTGLSKDKLLAKSWDDFDLGGTIAKERADLMKEKHIGPYELNLLIDGEPRVWCIEDYLLPDKGERYQIWSFVEDITDEVDTRDRLSESEERYKATFERANIGIAQVGLDGSWLTVNHSLCQFLGYDEQELVTKTFQDLTYPDDLDKDLGLLNEMLEGKIQNYKMEKRYIRKDGETVWATLSVALIRNRNGEPQYFISVVEDITYLKRELMDLNQARVVFNSTQEGILVCDANGTILSINPSFKKITGFQEEDTIGQNVRMLKSHEHTDAFYSSIRGDLQENGAWSGEIINRHKDGQKYSIYLNINAIRDEDNQIVQFIGVLTDISQVKKSQERIHFLANHDALTGLPNRTLMTDRLHHAIEKCKRASSKVAVLFIDLDRFKVVNDGLGHQVGDSVLKAVAERFKAQIRVCDTISRIGGDEFIIIAEEIENPLDTGKIAANIIETLKSPLMIEDKTIQMGCSIGISIYPDDGYTPEELIRQADIAMYEAKNKGRNNYHFTTDELSASALEKVVMEQSIRDALHEKQFYMAYQPVMDLTSQKAVGVEALLRWKHPKYGVVPPSQVIPIAEESNLILDITQYVLKEVIKDIEVLHKNVGDDQHCYVAINISSRDLENQDLVKQFKKAVTEQKISGHEIVLELTERKFILGNDNQSNAMKEYTGCGIKIAIDDFGTGFSNLGYLSDLPIDLIKIDRSFVKEIGASNKAEEIIKATISIANALSLKSIAEGIETQAQLDFLREHSCDFGQGYLFSEAKSLSALLKEVEIQ
jgi:two-component system CheB/CheR fusion protein